jgi:hypothetical protein
MVFHKPSKTSTERQGNKLHEGTNILSVSQIVPTEITMDLCMLVKSWSISKLLNNNNQCPSQIAQLWLF